MCVAAFPQEKLTIDQLVSFVASSIKLEHADGRVAKYLKDIVLAEQLDERTIRSLIDLGAGPKTITALRSLSDASQQLPTSAPPVQEEKRPPMPPPSRQEQKRIIEEVRDYALSYIKGLPDFICTQVTRRFADPSGLEFWRSIDTVTTRLTYFEQQEEYQVVMVNNRPVDLSVDDLGGSTSTGEFGTLLHNIFKPETEATFEWVRWGKLRDKLAHVYSYHVRREKSEWSVSYERKQSVVPAYSGLIYVDRDTLMILRITIQTQDIPPSFPIQEAGTVLDYDYVDISERDYMLPLKYEMRMRQGRILTKNETEFRLYRKFGAETVLSFDTPEPLPDEMTTEQPPTQ